MKIAITADLHLTSKYQHPERYQTLENILISLVSNQIDTLIIAGDLFDSSLKNPSEFEALCGQDRFRDINLLLLPGNHDPSTTQADFTLPNIRVVAEPMIVDLGDDSYPFFFLPYQEGLTMGEVLSRFHEQLTPNKWILVGHGDWSSHLQPNPYEPGVYMPLTRTDIETFRPAQVFLGHIHSPMDQPPVYYPGSPCGLNITETGKRRILIYDTKDGRAEPMTIDTPIIYFDEMLLIVPVDNEEKILRDEVRQRIQSWDIEAEDSDKVLVRVGVKGYSTDRGSVMDVIKDEFKEFAFYDGGEPDLSFLLVSDDGELNTMAASVKEKIMALNWASGIEEPSEDEIIFDALKVIYGE